MMQMTMKQRHKKINEEIETAERKEIVEGLQE
jgi:hypothetical protein